LVLIVGIRHFAKLRVRWRNLRTVVAWHQKPVWLQSQYDSVSSRLVPVGNIAFCFSLVTK
jgi:hypothetical protein